MLDTHPRGHVRRVPVQLAAAVLAVAATTGATSAAWAPGAAAATVPLSTQAPAVEWSVAPADDDGPDGRVSLRHVAEPGATVHDAIAVTNLSGHDATFEVRAGDGAVGGDGAFDLRPGPPVDAGSWVTVEGLEGEELQLGAGEVAVLPLTVTVPDDALPGDHPAGVVVAVSTAESGLTVTHRVGVRLHLQVAGDLVAALSVPEVEASFVRSSWVPFSPGVLRIDYTVANEGNVRLGASVGAGLTSPRPPGQDEASPATLELLPGTTLDGHMDIDAWPLPLLAGDVVASPLLIGEDQVTLPAAAGRPFTTWWVPLPELATIALLLLAGFAAVRRARRRSRRRESPVAVPGVADAGLDEGGHESKGPGPASQRARPMATRPT